MHKNVILPLSTLIRSKKRGGIFIKAEKIKLALIEDNKDLCKVLYDYFNSSENFEVIGVAHCVQDGMKIICERKPDLLLLDLVLKEHDGINVMEALNASTLESKPAIAVMTAINNDFVTKQVTELGAKYVFLKPFALVDVKRRLEVIAEQYFIERNSRELMVSDTAKSEKNVETEISGLLNDIGIAVNLKGFRYLKKCLALCINKSDYMTAITKELYPTVAKEFNTSPNSVERAIRHSIGVAWDRDKQGFSKINLRNNPSNGLFIATFLEYYQSKSRFI